MAECKCYKRRTIFKWDKIKGPLLIIENNQTIFVEDGWKTKFASNQFIILDRVSDNIQKVLII